MKKISLPVKKTPTPHSPPPPKSVTDQLPGNFGLSLSGVFSLWVQATGQPISDGEKSHLTRMYRASPPGTPGMILAHALAHWPEIIDNIDFPDGIAKPKEPVAWFIRRGLDHLLHAWRQSLGLPASIEDARTSEEVLKLLCPEQADSKQADDASMFATPALGGSTEAQKGASGGPSHGPELLGHPKAFQPVCTASSEPASPISQLSDPAPTIKRGGGNTGELVKIWSSVISEVYGEYVPPFTKKQLGQLKRFGEACPIGKAEQILKICLQNWSLFTKEAKNDYAAFPVPSRPTLDFLVKYIAAATNFGIQEIKHEEKKAAQIASMSKVPSTPPIKTKMAKYVPPEPKATVEEINAIFGIKLTKKPSPPPSDLK